MVSLEWTQLQNLEIATGTMGVAEVRDGPGDRILVLGLEPGTFRPCLGVNPADEAEGAISTLRVVHESTLGGWRSRRTPAQVERGGIIDWMSTDIATAGIFDYELLKRFAERDGDAFLAWQEGFYAAMQWPHGFAAFGGDARVPLFYAQGLGGVTRFPICELHVEGRPVGIEIVFSPRLFPEKRRGPELLIERVEHASALGPITVGGVETV